MIYDNSQPDYSVLDLGYNKSLTKSTFDINLIETTPEMSNVITSGVAPKSLTSGELISEFEQKAGTLFSGKSAFDNTETGYRLGIDPSDSLAKFYIGNTTSYLNWTGTALVIAGSLSATTGTIGGFEIGSDYIRDLANSMGLASTVTGGDDVRFWAGDTYANRATADFFVLESGAVTASNITITGGTVGSSVVVAIGALNIAARGWTQTSVFSVTDADTVAWAAGTLTSADGTAYSIGGGNTGNMAAATYIYLDVAVSTTAYQSTTTAATAVGAGKVLIAKAENGTGEATFQVFGGIGGTNIAASSIVANSITANELSTSITYAGSIVIDTAGLIRSGQTAYNTGTGWWIGNDAGTPKLSIGNSAGNRVTWDGSTLTIVGAPVITYANGTATKNINDASATQNIAHGLGVVPKKVYINGKVASAASICVSDTVYTSSQASNYVFCETGSGTVEAGGATFSFTSSSVGADDSTGVVTTDATNIIITWTKTGNPTGTAYLIWEASTEL